MIKPVYRDQKAELLLKIPHSKVLRKEKTHECENTCQETEVGSVGASLRSVGGYMVSFRLAKQGLVTKLGLGMWLAKHVRSPANHPQHKPGACL